MHIKFLGTRGEVDSSAPMHKKHSGILIDGILFDVGEKEFLDLKPKEIFCTHLHPDHAFWIGTKEEPPPHFFYPENIKLLEPMKVGDIKVTPIPTIHSKKVRSVAYLIEKDHLRVLYTGDLIWIKKKYQDLLKDLDLVITDGSFNRKGGMIRRDKKTGEVYGHAGIPNLADLFKKLNAKRIIVTHFGEWFLKDVEKGKEQIRGYSDSIKVEPAFDGKEITLEEKSELGKTTTEEVEPVSPKTIAKIQPKAGLYLVAPHAEMIMTGQKTLIVKSKKFTSHINEPLYLLQDKLCFGIITLKEPYEISPEEFKKLRDKHQITDEEAFKHWGWKEDAPLYAYEFRIDEQFEPPIPVKLPKGIQVFVDAKNIKFQDLKSLTILDLFDFADLEISDELFAKVSEEMFNRGLLQTELIKEATKDWVNQYIKNLKKYTRAQVGDDFRIVLGWYSSIKRGKKITKHTDVGDLPITEEDCKKLAVAIVKELIDRGATFNKPETYKKHARELFETVIKEIGVDKIPWKETEEKAKTVPEPTQVGIPNLEDIDDVYVSKLTDDQLMALHKKLHEIFKKLGKVTEPLQNAHIFVWKEMQKRKLPHQIEDGLDRATSLEVIEYPEPEEGVPQQISSEEEITLERVLKAFPEKVFVEDPIHVYLCGRVVNEGKIPASHDIDLLFKQGWYHVPTIRAFLNEISERDPEVAKRLHFVWDSKGPHIGMTVPVYRLSFERVSDDEMRRTSPFEFLAGAKAEIFKPYIGLKPKSGFQKNEFWDIKEMWDKWAKKYIDKGIIVQKKFDGMRFQVHCKGNQCKFITEDRERDRASVFKKSLAELLKNKKADSFIIDAEMVEYACGDKKVSHPDMCEQVPREEMIKWIGAEKKELDDENVVFHVHDCTYLNGEPLNDKPYVERWEAIKKVFPDNLRHWKRIDGEKATDMKTFFRLAKKYRSLMNSEGIVAKASDSIYPIKYSGENRAADWAKLKNLKEIDVMVWKVIQKKTKEGKPLNQYLYECIFAVPCKDLDKYRERDIVKRDGKCYLWIGRTYATGEKVSPGTIVTVRPIRIAEFKDPKGKIYYTWMFPYYEGKHPAKKEPDSIDVVKKLVAIGTGPPPEQLGAWVFDLPICPFWNDERICPLKERFRMPRDNLSSILVEYLKYPIVCPFANHYKCRYVKSYYYGYKEWKVQSEVDEDTGEEIDENQE